MRWGVGGGERRLAGAGEVGFDRVNWGGLWGKAKDFPGARMWGVWCNSWGRGLEGEEYRNGDAGCRQHCRHWDLSDLPLLWMMSCGAGGAWICCWAGASLPLLASDCKTLLWSVEASGKQFKQWQLCLIKEKKNTANLQMPSLCLEYSSERLYLLGGKAGKFPHLSKDPCFSFRNFPVKRCGCYWDTPPPQLSLLVQLCFAMAFPSAFPSLCWAGFCRGFFFVLPFPGLLPFCGEPRGIPTGWSRGMDLLRVAGITWLSPCVSAPLGAPDRCYWQRGWFWSQCRNHCLFSPDAQPPAPWCLRSLSCRPSPLRYLYKQELSGLCFWKTLKLVLEA